MAQIPLETYLSVLRDCTPENHPYKKMGPEFEAVGVAFAGVCQAVHNFIQAARVNPGVGYDAARAELEDVVHLFPLNRPARPAPSPQAIVDELEALFRTLGNETPDEGGETAK